MIIINYIEPSYATMNIFELYIYVSTKGTIFNYR